MTTTKGFIFDYSKCVGCHACLVACYAENKTKPPLSWRQVNHFNKQKLPLLGFVHLSIACNHCNEAPCIKACPSGAYKVDPDTNAVIHTPDLCLGCKYCTWACPFDAPKYNPQEGIVEKCHFCSHRIKEGGLPACALNCPTGALSFGPIDSNPSPSAFGLSKKSIYPRLKVLGEGVKDSVPLADRFAATSHNSIPKRFFALPSILSPWDEWPLALFTFTGALLVGLVWAGLSVQTSLLPLWLFVLLGFLGVMLSTLHLGKPFRAYKSILNLKSSWLSKEIFMFGVFMLVGFFAILTNSKPLLYMAGLLGLLFLLSIEMLYAITKRKYLTPLHSANTVITALVFATLFSDNLTLLVALLALKAMLFILNRRVSDIVASRIFSWFSLFRVLLGIAIPIIIVLTDGATYYWLLTLSIILGEIFDRFLYYGDIEPERPFR